MSTPDVIDYDELARLLDAGIRRSAASLGAGPKLLGYALCTDDEVCGVYDAACTEKQFPGLESPEARDLPVEWTEVPWPDELKAASRLLQKRAQLDGQGDSHTQIDRAFDCLVAAMLKARSLGLFDGGVFLTVCSTDPCKEMESAADAATRRLNPPELVRAWLRARLETARSVLASIEANSAPRSFDMQDFLKRLKQEIGELEQEIQ